MRRCTLDKSAQEYKCYENKPGALIRGSHRNSSRLVHYATILSLLDLSYYMGTFGLRGCIQLALSAFGILSHRIPVMGVYPLPIPKGECDLAILRQIWGCLGIYADTIRWKLAEWVATRCIPGFVHGLPSSGACQDVAAFFSRRFHSLATYWGTLSATTSAREGG